MTPEEFRRAGTLLVDRIADHLETLPSRSVTGGLTPDEVRTVLDASAPLPHEGSDPEAILGEAAELLFKHSLFNAHPRFMAYVTAPAAPLGILADFLASAVNPNMGAWSLSPVATEIESQSVRWIAELVGYPADSGGLLVSGGNMANFVGFYAARARIGERWRVRETGQGAEGAPRLTAYVSEETHTWVQKVSDLAGLGTDAVRWIPTDDGLRMDMGALRDRVAEDRATGFTPFFVVGTAGTVSTGAVDPLSEIAAFCRDEDLWFHVDGAYGGFAAAAPNAPAALAGMAEADSLAIDPHKWLYTPLEAGCALIRDVAFLRQAFSYHPPYYYFGQEATNYVDLGPQNSRGFRALKVWLQLKQVGRRGYEQMIADDIRLAERLHEEVTAHPDFEPIAQGLSISAFRYVPADLRDSLGEEATETYLNGLNQEIQGQLERGGELFISNAVVEGMYSLRACIVNYNTGLDDVLAVPEITARVGAEAHEALGGP